MPDHYRDSKRHRSRSPGRHRHEGDHRRPRKRRSRSPPPPPPPVQLPLNARPLSKHHLKQFRNLFGLYLDIQKQMDIQELDETEVKGRWKSFVGKWNRAELAEGWYDMETKQKADSAALKAEHEQRTNTRYESEQPASARANAEATDGEIDRNDDDDDEGEGEGKDDDEDDYGPSLPRGHSRAGPAMPRFQDLQHRNELTAEDEDAQRDDLRYARKMDRKVQKERQEEMLPRAEPGTRERQLEKKREKADANRSFRDAKSPGAEEVGEGELLGGDEGIKAHLQAVQRKKTERELRKEEITRAREAEREERLAVHRAKEDKTMDMLKALARQRFG